jgi:hypothetical protein
MWHLLVTRLLNLLRTRVVMSCLGLVMMAYSPATSQYVVAIVGLALGVSALEVWRGANGDTRTRIGKKGKDEEET